MTPLPGSNGPELVQLNASLDAQRGAVLRKVEGLDREQLATRLPPSTLTLGGLINHLALVEDWWFRVRFAGLPEDEVRAIVGGNAAELYGFDLAALQPLVDRIGPIVAEIAAPLERVPDGGLKCPAFDDWARTHAAVA